jgi:uncharacterized protein YeaO (DUF488 family)
MIRIKRAYEKPEASDGYRVLVDRLWPRGKTKEELKLDVWLKEVSPSTELRKFYNHELEKWTVFKKLYQKELKERPKAQKAIAELAHLSTKKDSDSRLQCQRHRT